jgi:signal peptidase I
MQEKIKKINLKILSIVGIILSVSALILSATAPNSGNEELNTFDTWAVLTVFLAVIYLLVFSILNLLKPRKTLSVIGIILSSLAFVLGSIFVFKPSQPQLPKLTLLDIAIGFLFLSSTLFLGIISIVSFLKAPKQQTTKPSLEPEVSPKPETKTKIILKNVLWTIGALLVGFIIFLIIGSLGTDIYVHLFIPDYLSFYKDPPSWYFLMKTILAWIGFVLGWLIIIFITYKKVERKTAKAFLLIFSLLIILSLVEHFVIQPFSMNNEWLEPYLHKGDYVLVEKFNKSIRKGDIVITRNRNIVSLVIGLPGDKIELKNGTFFVNGEPLKNVSYNFYHVYGMDYNTGNYFIVVPPDSFFGISTLLEEKFADNEQKTQEKQTTSDRFCPYENSYFNPKDNLCYCKEGFILNKKEGKDIKCVKGIDLSIYLYKQSDIFGKVIYPIHTH